MRRSLRCLRMLPYETILTQQNVILGETILAFIPIGSTDLIPGHPIELLDEVKALNITTFFGTCKDVGSLYLILRPGFDFKVNGAFFKVAIAFMFDDFIPIAKKAVIFQYTVLTGIVKSGYFTEPARVAETIELPYVFGYSFEKLYFNRDIFTLEDHQVSLDIMNRCGNIMRTGNPNGLNTNDVVWPQFDSDTFRYCVFHFNPSIRHHLKSNNMQFWNRFKPALLDAV
ncbi:Cholinesterase [Trichoplax sp. H2]|nr:Cholinesterase [Trichoplax sp. H2]|eukprot:RDD41342.1 Cholinesterase [Trichoplax sp. H2]